MKKNKLFTLITLVLVSVVLVAAAPMDKSELVSLTIENRSNDYVTYKLTGPQFYFLSVKPHTTSTFTVIRGDYTQRFYSCGAFVTTTLDFTKKQSIVVPICGEKAFKSVKASSGVVDGGRLIKLVKVTLENTTDVNLVLVMTGPSEHVFFIRSGEDATYTIARGTYQVKQYGCKYFKTFNFYSYANKEKDLTCPSW